MKAGFSFALLRATMLTVGAAPALAGPTVSGLIAPSYFVGDLVAAKKFYVDGLGMHFISDTPKGARHECVVRFDKDPSHAFIILNYGTAPNSPPLQVHEFGKLVLRMPKLDEVSKRLITAGFKPSEIRTAGAYRIMTVADPDGRIFQLVEEVRRAPQ